MNDANLLLGAILAFGATCCYEIGYALQALEARQAPRSLSLRPSLIVHLARRRRWLIAVGISLLGWPLQIIALGRAPLTLVQPILALGLLLLLTLGVKLLGERVGPREVVAVAIIIASVAVIAVSAPSEPGEVPRDAGLAIVLGALGLLVLLPFGIARVRRGVYPVAAMMIAAGAADGIAAFVAKLIAEDVAGGAWGDAIAWGALVAGGVGLGVIAETTALQRMAATRVAPTILVLQIAIPVVLAPLVGGENWSSTPGGGAALIAALAALLAGIAVLAGSPAVAGLREATEGKAAEPATG